MMTPSAARLLHDAVVDPARLGDGAQVFRGDLGEQGLGDLDRLVEARDAERPFEAGHGPDERGGRPGRRGLADKVGDVDREEIARADEPVDRRRSDVVGVDVIRVRPARGADRLVRRPAGVLGRGPDDRMLAVGLVPDRGDGHALATRRLQGPELGPALAPEPVPYPQGVLLELRHQAGSPNRK